MPPATTVTTPCKCDCHLGPFVLCTVPGGCRKANDCTRQGRTPGSCPSCWRRDPDPSKGDGRVCGPCERWWPILIASIVDKTAELPDLILPEDWAVDDRWFWHWHPRRKDPQTGELLPAEGEWRRAEPLTAVGGAGLVPGQRRGPKVRTTQEGSPTPLRLDVVDLLGPVVRDGGRPVDAVADWWLPRVVPTGETVPVVDKDGQVIGWRQPTRTVWAPPDDQTGHIPVAQVLDQEVRAWMDAGAPGSRWRPVPTVPELGRWLTNRVGWACENYGPIDESRIALNRLRGVLMGVLDEFDPEPELCVGVECNRCDKRMLMRRNDGTGDVECAGPNCGKIMTAAEYQEWAKRQGAWEASQRSPEEVRELLRPTYRLPADTPVTSTST